MRAEADAVDSAMGPAPSSLPPGPNLIAQALLQDPSLRGLRANLLGQRFGGSTTDARQAIGAIVGMIQRTARGNVTSALQVERSLGSAIGPFMSLDDAMSRYGANMGAIVTSPNPVLPSAMWRPDYPPDRQGSAGALSDDTPPPITDSPGSTDVVETAPVALDAPAAPETTAPLAPSSTLNSTAPTHFIGPAFPSTPAPVTYTPTGLTSPSAISPWLLAAAAAAGGLVLLSRSKRKPRWLAKLKIA